jgi:hypothetical protein
VASGRYHYLESRPTRFARVALATVIVASEEDGMADYGQDLDLAALAELLTEAFMDGKHVRRFCRNNPKFREVEDLVSPEASLSDHVDVLIRYSETQLLFPELLAGVKWVSPRQYARYAPRLGISDPDADSSVSRAAAVPAQGQPAGGAQPPAAESPAVQLPSRTSTRNWPRLSSIPGWTVVRLLPGIVAGIIAGFLVGRALLEMTVSVFTGGFQYLWFAVPVLVGALAGGWLWNRLLATWGR